MSINVLNLNKILYDKIKNIVSENDMVKVAKICSSLNLHLVHSITPTNSLYYRNASFNETNNTLYFSYKGFLTKSKPIWGWGYNGFGELGDVTTTSKYSPISTVGEFVWSDISNGLVTLGLRNDNTLWAWGPGSNGHLGDGTTVNKSSPVSVIGGFTWKYIHSGGACSSAIKSDDTLWTWGYNFSGQLGTGTVTARSSPGSLIAPCNAWTWTSVSIAGLHIGAIKSDGTLWMWGDGTTGKLGNGTTTNRSSPTSLIAPANAWTWRQVSAGTGQTAAIKSDNTLWTWGTNTNGQLGNNTAVSTSSPVSVVGGFTWKYVNSGQYHVIAIKSDDTLWAWGINDKGMLGDGTTTNRSSPVSLITPANTWTWKQVSSGYFSIAAIRTDDTLWLWGGNNSGCLGDGTTINRSSPKQLIYPYNTFTWKTIKIAMTTAYRTQGIINI